MNKAIDFSPLGWNDPDGWSHHADKCCVLLLHLEKEFPKSFDVVYARETKKHGHARGHKMRWVEYWGDPAWEEAYYEQLYHQAWELEWAAEDRFQEFCKIVAEQRAKALARKGKKKHRTRRKRGFGDHWMY